MDDSVTDATPGHELETDHALIVQLLGRLADRPESATLWLNAGRARLPVRLKGVELASGRLLLRMPEEAKDQLTESALTDSAVCVMNLPDSSIRFGCGKPEFVQDRKTVTVSIPESVYRLSRRSGFRVPLPRAASLRVGTVDGERDGHAVDVLDLSLGGLGLLAGPDYAAAREFGECTLDLPGGPSLEVDLRVCNRAPFMRLDGRQGVRLGLAFVGLPPIIRSRLRRYLEALESHQ